MLPDLPATATVVKLQESSPPAAAQALANWSTRHIPDRWPQPKWFVEGTPEDFYPAPG